MIAPEGGWELMRDDPEWPQMLNTIDISARCIRGIGDVSLLQGPCISVIGTRKATPYGLLAARMVGKIAAQSGITVVSGGAVGCDYAAGRACLDAGGTTIVCAGCGADVTYPRSSTDLFRDARTHSGAVISLEAWGASPKRYYFPKRNVLIAGLSKALVVVEAGLVSGTHQTATVAAQAGRMVYAVPGSIFSSSSQGANALIENGASIITDSLALQTLISLDYGEEVLKHARSRGEELSAHTSPVPEFSDELLNALVAMPTHVETLARELNIALPALITSLSNYEARGIVQRLADGRYSLSETGYMLNTASHRGESGG